MKNQILIGTVLLLVGCGPSLPQESSVKLFQISRLKLANAPEQTMSKAISADVRDLQCSLVGTDGKRSNCIYTFLGKRETMGFVLTGSGWSPNL
jgi:hypothetical protein